MKLCLLYFYKYNWSKLAFFSYFFAIWVLLGPFPCCQNVMAIHTASSNTYWNCCSETKGRGSQYETNLFPRCFALLYIVIYTIFHNVPQSHLLLASSFAGRSLHRCFLRSAFSSLRVGARARDAALTFFCDLWPILRRTSHIARRQGVWHGLYCNGGGRIWVKLNWRRSG